MWVRMLIGRAAGHIVEMSPDAATSNLAAGTVARVSDEEREAAGLLPDGGLSEVSPEKLLASYRIEPSPTGRGFDLLDAGGVRINDEGQPIHNHAAARQVALDHARDSRGLDPLSDDAKAAALAGGGFRETLAGRQSAAMAAGETVPGPTAPDQAESRDYEAMTRSQIEEIAARRQIDLSHAKNKHDAIAAVELADKIADGNYDMMTRVQLDALADERGVNISEAKNKNDVITALRAAAPRG